MYEEKQNEELRRQLEAYKNQFQNKKVSKRLNSFRHFFFQKKLLIISVLQFCPHFVHAYFLEKIWCCPYICLSFNYQKI
jgi:hypothetical protein